MSRWCTRTRNIPDDMHPRVEGHLRDDSTFSICGDVAMIRANRIVVAIDGECTGVDRRRGQIEMLGVEVWSNVGMRLGSRDGDAVVGVINVRGTHVHDNFRRGLGTMTPVVFSEEEIEVESAQKRDRSHGRLRGQRDDRDCRGRQGKFDGHRRKLSFSRRGAARG